ncbi:aminotransferase class I/II-fold pyridoxal phosphate-dependent enzyme [Dactylosporangium roseum]|uniref:Aminotransferase class I/II-fold pyridoxal phosphate-dependent enzyme n=1 Tax=Dactylosporangium roseum TaxID=47989 RepID=A0ABY5ZAL2_9ACTN|nr:aminotransferase class I/II-fold pyridoxal phosphate-dependent enzyme [Dactylosporangium roseum]UWZ39125.1 aminotransferase class I/II-fold pyridoxal phosphate-dependent enzyme [Dactylosporangium roseum]
MVIRQAIEPGTGASARLRDQRSATGSRTVRAPVPLRIRRLPGRRRETVAVALHAMLDAAFEERKVLVATPGPDGTQIRLVDLTGVDVETRTLTDIQRLLDRAPACVPTAAGGGHLVSTLSPADHAVLVARLRPGTVLHLEAVGEAASLTAPGCDRRETEDLATVLERAWDRAAGGSAALPLQRLFAVPRTDAPRPVRVDSAEPDRFVTRFSAVCADTPDAIAIEAAGGTVTYGALERQADTVAWQLERLGAGPGRTVFVVPNRDPLLVAVLVGAFKAGATLALADPRLPVPYLRSCADAARADVVLDLAHVGLPGAVAGLDDTPSPHRYPRDRLGPDDPAFVTFTSGTSGAPKAVLGRYGSLTHFFDWMDRVLGPLRGRRFGMCSSLGHDPLQRDIMTPLYLRGTICVPAEADLTDVGAFPGWLADERIEVVCVNPAAIGLLAGADADALPALHRVFCVGAALTRGQARNLARVAPNARLVNLYGSTETQRAVGYYRLPATRAELDAVPLIVPVGTGMQDAELLVVTPGRHRCLPWQRGQIAVRSRHVGLGYLGDAGTTAAKFRTDVPVGEDPVPTYLTGDVGYRSPRHGVVFVGREDAQVKINGHRVELEQVTEACRDHPLVRDVATVAVDVDGLATLATFLVPTDPVVRFDPAAFRAALTGRLPAYMVPHKVTTVTELPLTHNRKLDTATLAAWAREPTTTEPDGDPGSATADAGVEESVRDFVRRHAGLDEPPTDVPLADLGIDSLRFASLVSQLGAGGTGRVRLGNTATVAELTSALIGSDPSTPAPAAPGPVTGQPAAATVRTLLGHASRVTETTVEVGGRRLHHLCSNSYLGLGSHPGIRERVARFVRDCPSYGSHGSGEVNGWTGEHERLITVLRELFGCPSVTLTSSGYLANVSAIPAVVDPGGMLFVDEYSHRSILDGCVLSGAPIHVYRHGDPGDLAALLRRHRAGPGSVIVSEAVSGSTGAVADLPRLAACARRTGCTLYVDEASSLGQLGATGRGIEEHFGLPGVVDVRTGSLAKALAGSGGFVAGSAATAARLSGDRGATFTTSITPLDAFVAAETAQTLADEGAGLVGRLHRNRDRWRAALHAAGLDTGASASAVVPILAADDAEVARWCAAVLDAGALVLPMAGAWSARVRALRTTVTAAHDPATLDDLAHRIGAAVAATGDGTRGG